MRKNGFDESLQCIEEALKISMQMPLCGGSEKDHRNLMNCLDGTLEAVTGILGTQHSLAIEIRGN